MPLILRQLIATWLPMLLAIACVFLVPWYCYQEGLEKGRLEVRSEADKQTIASLNELMSSHRKLIIDANNASEQMLTLEHQRQVYDMATTKTLQEVLNETAALRADCLFDDNVMRELDKARRRAAEAAASGIDDAVSGTSGAD